MKGSKKERAAMKERQMRPPVGDATATVDHRYIKQRPFFSHAGEPGAGDVDFVPSRSRGPRPDELGVFEVAKVDKEEGSIGGEQIAGGFAHYDQARLGLRKYGIFMPPRGGHEESDELIRYLAIALREKAEQTRRKNQTTRADLAGWKPGQNMRALRGWNATDLSLSDDPDQAVLRARAAAAEQIHNTRRRKHGLRMSRSAPHPPGFTKARARECALEIARNCGLI
jgi:hypothetical protein